MAERETTEWNEADAARLMDLLYGEASDAEAARAGLAPAERTELESFASLRTLLAQVEDHEPPARLSAQLIAAAAAEHAAPSREERRGGLASLFAGLFRPIFAHPGAAALASLVVVAGVAGTLHLGGRHRMVEPTLAQAPAESVAPAEQAKAPEPLVGGAAAGEAAAADEEGSEGELALDGLAQGFTETTSSADKAASTGVDSKRGARSKNDRMRSTSSKGGGAPPLRSAPPPPSKKSPAKAPMKSEDSDDAFERPADRAGAKPESRPTVPVTSTSGTSAPAAEPAAPPAPSPQTAPAPEQKQVSKERAASKDSPAADGATLRSSAIALAKKGDCERALAVLRRLSDVSPSDYTAARKDPAVERCRAAVSK